MDLDNDDIGGDWAGDDGDDDLFGDDDDAFGGDLDDEDNGDSSVDANGMYVAPNPGKKISNNWVDSSNLAGDHVAAGSFTTAMKLLNRQIGVVNFKPLKESFNSVFQGNSCAMPMSIGAPSASNHFLRTGDSGSKSLPRVAIRLENLTREVKLGYKAFVAGKFSEAE